MRKNQPLVPRSNIAGSWTRGGGGVHHQSQFPVGPDEVPGRGGGADPKRPPNVVSHTTVRLSQLTRHVQGAGKNYPGIFSHLEGRRKGSWPPSPPIPSYQRVCVSMHFLVEKDPMYAIQGNSITSLSTK